MQRQILAMQVQQQQQATHHLEAKVPLVRIQLDDLNKREEVVDQQIASLQRYINFAKSNGSIDAAKEKIKQLAYKSLGATSLKIKNFDRIKSGHPPCNLSGVPNRGKVPKYTSEDEAEKQRLEALVAAVEREDYVNAGFTPPPQLTEEIAQYEKAVRNLEMFQREKAELRNKKQNLENQIQTFLRQ